MNYVIGVSGGVDSVVLLDILARQQNQPALPSGGVSHEGVTRALGGEAPHLNSLQVQAEGADSWELSARRLSDASFDRNREIVGSRNVTAPPKNKLIIAHVDHGIRPESVDDERFVRALAKQYRLPYTSTRLELGEDASEETARTARYDFLLATAKEHKAVVVTAHHQDDVIGSIAINLQRGTGWRGLAVMNRPNLKRPLIGWTKQAVYRYALDNRLEWVEDATNQSDKYLRNRLRKGVVQLPDAARSELVSLRAGQLQLGHDIDQEIAKLLLKFGDSRYHYGAVESQVAVELLKKRFAITGPQAELTLLAIKTARSSATHVVNKGLKLRFTKTDFIVDSHL